MIRKYLENMIAEEMKEENPDFELIKKWKSQDAPYKKIYIENDITIATLKKVAKTTWFNLDQYSEMEQLLENLDNGFITDVCLDKIINVVFKEKSDGRFTNGTKNTFGNRNKCRFIKSKLQELLESQK